MLRNHPPIRKALGLLLCAWTLLVTGTCAWAQTCPPDATGSCLVAHQSPGCADTVCCATVCAIDSYCCLTQWDGQCAFFAQFNCQAPPPVPCGSTTESCFVVHSTPSCADAPCCETVCSTYPYCCSVSWDLTCRNAAIAACATFCIPTCPPQSLNENEPCNTPGAGNAPCINGVANTTILTVQNAMMVCGTIRSMPANAADLDAFKIVLPDADGNGLARISIELQAEQGTTEAGTTPLFAALIASPCQSLAQAALSVQTNGCSTQQLVQCVSAGTWYLVVTRGTFPTPAPLLTLCDSVQSYNLKVSWDDLCSNPCGSTGDCFAVHASAGCQIASCCQSVCQLDPTCCSKLWDQVCVDLAVTHCNPPIPANDQCANASAISLGSAPFTLVGATASSLAPPTQCTMGTVNADIWFLLKNVRGMITLSTCAVGSRDTGIIVYPATCASVMTAIICNDNDNTCTSNTKSASVSFQALCSSQYLVRIVGVGAGGVGNGTLTVTSSMSACPACVADINGSGSVDGNDLTILLSGWGGAGASDIDGNGITNGIDLTTLLSGWGLCP